MNETKEQRLLRLVEILVVVLLGLTALLTAWASWIGSLHGGNQATNYTLSTNLASEGNSEYNAGSQYLMQDMLLWNEIADLQMDIIYSTDEDEIELACTKLYYKMNENLSEDMAAQIAWTYPDTYDIVDTIYEWMEYDEAWTSPFFSQDYIDSYYDYAFELLAESEEALAQGKEDNANGDAFGLVTVIYSVSLFLLGMVSTIEDKKNKYALLIISVVSVLAATIYMITLPLPTGFSITSFFGS